MSTTTLHTEKKKTLVPKLRFQEFDGEWDEIKLGKLAEKIGDGLHGTPIYSDDSDINFINGNNLTNGKIEITEKTKKVDYAIFLKNDKGLNENTILISLNGTIGNIAKYNNEKVMLGKSVGYFNFKENIDFYFHVFHTDKIQNFFISELTGSTIKNLSLKTLRETVFPIPILPEQQKISSFLNAVDEKIQQISRKKELLEKYKKGVMQQLFSGKLRFKDENEKDYLDWENKKLGDLVIIKSGNSPSDYNLVNEGINPFIKVDELNNCSKYQNKSRFYSNDDKNIVEAKSVIFPKRGAAILNNKVRINDCPILMDSNMMALIPLRNELDVEFLYFKIVMAELYKIADTSSIPQINNKHIEPYIISTPCLEEQQKIAAFLSSIDTKIESASQQINQTQSFKKGLLQQLFV